MHLYLYLHSKNNLYTFVDNNNIYIYDLYAHLHLLLFTYGRWKSPEHEDDPTQRTSQRVYKPYLNFVVFVAIHVFARHPRRPSTKCLRDKMAGDEVSPRRNSWRRTVPATKRQATKCPRDEMAGDETAATKGVVPLVEEEEEEDGDIAVSL